MANPPTLKDLALELGLSVPTVSLGLRNAGNISKATCQRIKEAAERIGYRPNPHAAALSAGARTGARHGVPLAILRLPLRGKSTLYPIEDFVTGIVRRATELGYQTEQLTLKSTSMLPRLLKNFYCRGFQGIFLPPIGNEMTTVKFDWSMFSVVACGRYDQTSPFHTVRQEIFESTRYMFSEMIRRGYRRIYVALLRHDPKLIDDFARLAAAQVCKSPRVRIKIDVPLIEDTFASLASLLIKEKADAVVGFSVSQYFLLREAGLKVPEDIGFASLHTSNDLNGMITGMIELNEHAGVVAANRMDTMIRHHERGLPIVPEQITLASQWSEGTTLPFRR
jgi:DNA-binding LacI/PurR family transcriptional regulator